MFDLLLMVVNSVEVGLASTVVVVLLIGTCACGDASMPVFTVVPLTMIGCWSTPFRGARG